MAPLLVLVSGPPGAGKTTLARRLAADLQIPLLGKDTIKEALGEELIDVPLLLVDTADGYRPDYPTILSFVEEAR